MLAEDNEINQQVVEELLSQAGMDVTIATNGQRALTTLTARTTVFDALLIDTYRAAQRKRNRN